MTPLALLRSSASLGIVAMISACATAARVTYNMSLKEVQRPADVAKRWGDFTLQTSPDGFTYQDNLVQLLVVPVKGSFVLTVSNKTSYSMQFLWDQASYVGPDGISSMVSSGETRCIQMGQSRPPETIPANARAILTVIPSSLVYTP